MSGLRKPLRPSESLASCVATCSSRSLLEALLVVSPPDKELPARMVRRARASQVVRGERTDGTKHTCHPRAPRGRLGSCLSPVASLRLRRCACSVPRARVRARSFSRSVSSSLRTKQIERARYHTNLGTRSVAACSITCPAVLAVHCGVGTLAHTHLPRTRAARARPRARAREPTSHSHASPTVGGQHAPASSDALLDPRRIRARAHVRARSPSRIGLARARTRARARASAHASARRIP